MENIYIFKNNFQTEQTQDFLAQNASNVSSGGGISTKEKEKEED